MNKRWVTPAAIVAVAIVVGCRENSQRAGLPGTRRGESSSTPTPPAQTARDAPVITLTSVDRTAYDAAIAKHRGKVVLVDFWATWCLPCVEQLPHTLELGRQLGDRGLSVVTVSCDEPKEAESVAKFLAARKADVATNLISQFGGSSATMEAFEIEGGAVPFYKLYDRKGELRQTFGITAPGEIDRAVDKLLNK
jgi:thiol-disulfide isomerase/thioredoxin